MMRTTIALLCLLVAGTAQATCIYPRPPQRVPDGATASRDDMVAAQKEVQQFNDDITAFTACLEMEMEAYAKSGLYDENRLQELRAMQAKKNNAAVDDAESVAGLFNEQLRIFLAREKKD